MHILITLNSSSEGAVEASLLLSTYLQSQNLACTVVDAYELDALDPANYSMAVSLGGDGTMLRAAHFAGSTGLPILGLNFGNLGFLTNRAQKSPVACVAAALAGDVVREERSNLRVDVLCEGEDEELFERAFNSPELLPENRRLLALNEAALARGNSGKVVDFNLRISDEHVANMRGDGMVVATATGSTAYALSAGGPLVAPGFQGLVAVPLAPHSLVARAIVTNKEDVLELQLGENKASQEAELFVDGHLVAHESPIRRLRVSRGPAPTVMLRLDGSGFYTHVSQVFFK